MQYHQTRPRSEIRAPKHSPKGWGGRQERADGSPPGPMSKVHPWPGRWFCCPVRSSCTGTLVLGLITGRLPPALGSLKSLEHRSPASQLTEEDTLRLRAPLHFYISAPYNQCVIAHHLYVRACFHFPVTVFLLDHVISQYMDSVWV